MGQGSPDRAILGLMSTSQLIGLAGSLIALLLSLLGFFIVRWMDRVERAINTLSEKYSRAQVRDAELTGSIDSLQKSVNQTHKDVGLLAASVQKVWDIMIGSGMAGERPSDKMLGNGPRQR